MYKISKWNSIVYFARKLPISFSDFYHHLEDKSSAWYRKTLFTTMHINLLQSPEDLLASYKYALRYDIKNALDLGLIIQRASYLQEAEILFQKTAAVHPDLVPYPSWLLKEQSGKYYSAIIHPDYGMIAAHLHIYDADEKMALLLINASDFRSYQDKDTQALIASANKLLFHDDFLFFKDLGAEKYDFGGYTEETKAFKKLFEGEIIQLYSYEPYFLYLLRMLKNVFK